MSRQPMTALDARVTLLKILLVERGLSPQSELLPGYLEKMSAFVCNAGPAAIAARLDCLRLALSPTFGFVFDAEQLYDFADELFEILVAAEGAMPVQDDRGGEIIALLTELRDLLAASVKKK